MGKNTGGPAFPELGNVAYNSDWQNESGMTLRDYFAAKCMAAVIGTLNGPVVGELYPGDFEHYAGCAYKMADAMLKAREAS
ncbi:hypothetical protein R0H17_15855 [Phytobacter diazotrophicus]|jgi:hypothetical protein|uniref:hypothetical protein n=1 Tax=Phytobacter diazotrophicus TaxID=395631 RepID=UPI0029358F9C|nr:hypothetical protein [Phytobacter diazotrophicus]MDV2903114.1 hypothetical protein [Phytobacter diazotrophicus]